MTSPPNSLSPRQKHRKHFKAMASASLKHIPQCNTKAVHIRYTLRPLSGAWAGYKAATHSQVPVLWTRICILLCALTGAAASVRGRHPPTHPAPSPACTFLLTATSYVPEAGLPLREVLSETVWLTGWNRNRQNGEEKNISQSPCQSRPVLVHSSLFLPS